MSSGFQDWLHVAVASRGNATHHGDMDDWFHGWFDEDYEHLYAQRDQEEARHAVATALRHAPELGFGPVLDLACWAGRHLLELRRANPPALGLDRATHLLGVAPPELGGNLLRRDMRHLPIRPGTLEGIALWFTPFGYFSDAANQALLKGLARCLRPGGVLLLDFFNAAHLRSNLVETEELEREGLRVQVRRSLEGDRVIKRMTLSRTDSGATREVVESVRVYDPQDLVAMAAASGLHLRAALGSYVGEAFDPEKSSRWIGIFCYQLVTSSSFGGS